ncbi:MAG: hypothetical protein AAF182_01150 [Pseudomonadota bacterium]
MNIKRLTKRFNNLNLKQSQFLSNVIGGLAQYLYESEHNLQEDLKTGLKTLIVCVDGDPGVGKSLISRQIVLKNTGGEGADNDHHKVLFPADETDPERICVYWHSYWSPKTQQENIMRDCVLTEPYKTNDIADTVEVKKRVYPGFEILEHSHSVPQGLSALKVEMQKQSETLRSAVVSIENINDENREKAEEIWSEFLDYLSEAPEMAI